MKKDIEWGIDQINKECNEFEDARYEREVDDFTTGVLYGLNKGLAIMSQLDEPETLSQKWIDKHSYNVHLLGTPDVETVAIPRDDLQNLLVPKQEAVKVSKEDERNIKQYKEMGWTLFHLINDLGANPERDELLAEAWLAYPNIEVEKEQKYYVVNNEDYFLLGKDKGHGFIFSTGGNSKLGSTERISATFELTEQEIKGYDPRYMTFAKPVEELEE